MHLQKSEPESLVYVNYINLTVLEFQWSFLKFENYTIKINSVHDSSNQNFLYISLAIRKTVVFI